MIKIFCNRCGKECVGKNSSARIQICGGLDLDTVVCTDCNNKVKEFIDIKESENMGVKTICDICGNEIKSQMLTLKKVYMSDSYPITINNVTIVEDCCKDCAKRIKNHIAEMKLKI